MELKDLIVEFDNIISDRDCDELIIWFSKNQQLHKPGMVYGTGNTGNIINEKHKILTQAELPLKHKVSEIVTDAVVKTYTEYTKIKPNPGFNDICIKDYVMKLYKKNEGFFATHIDQKNGNSSTRLFGLVFYLNDVEEGGETEFPDLNIKVKAKKGKSLIFPCNFLFPHRGNIPISNDKYAITCFINFSLNN